MGGAGVSPQLVLGSRLSLRLVQGPNPNTGEDEALQTVTLKFKKQRRFPQPPQPSIRSPYKYTYHNIEADLGAFKS